ncbi:MAG: putative sugar nucleotidyl transferase, partial [Owenweeksia sp.]
MNILLVDHTEHPHLLPLTFTRPAAELRVGILTIREKWQHWMKGDYGYITKDHLSEKYGNELEGESLLINGTVCPNRELIELIKNLKPGESLEADGVIIAQRGKANDKGFKEGQERVNYEGSFTHIDRPWKIFSTNHTEMESDFDLITKGRKSVELSATNTVLGNRIFVEEGVEAECAVFNTLSGPIYLGKDSVVMEGTVVRGGLALCEHSQLKLGTK